MSHTLRDDWVGDQIRAYLRTLEQAALREPPRVVGLPAPPSAADELVPPRVADALAVHGGRSACRAELAQSSRLLGDWLGENKFNVRRDLRTYRERLGPEFPARLDRLTPADTWVDFGAGRAVAVREYVRAAATPARTVAVSLAHPDPRELAAERSALGAKGFTYLEAPVGELAARGPLPGAAVVASDLWGALTYAEDLSACLEGELSLLPVGGTLHVVLGTDFRLERSVFDERGVQVGTAEQFQALKLFDPTGRPLPLERYLASLQGTRLLEPVQPGAFPTEVRFCLEKTEPQVKVPRLELVSLAPSGLPPERNYVLAPD